MRFEGNVLDDLRKEAAQRRTSLNTLATQIFKTYSEFSGAAAKAGMVPFPKGLMVRLMNKLPEEEIKELSEEIAKNEMKDTLLMIKRRYTADAFVELIESWCRVSGFDYTHDIADQTTHYFAVQHGMGKRWSIYLSEMFKFVFSDLGAKWADFETTDNTVTFNVEL